MASGQTTNLGLPQIIGTDLVNSSDINNGFYKIDEHAGVVNAKITKLETESGGSSEELENVNNTIGEVRDDITTIENSVSTNTQDIVLLKRHQNESDARIDALEGASGSSGGNNIRIVTVRVPSPMKTTEGYNLKNVPLSWARSDIRELIKNTFDYSSVDDFQVLAIMPYTKHNIRVTLLDDNGTKWSGFCDVHLENFSLIGTDELNAVKFSFLEILNNVPTYIADSTLELANKVSFGSSIDVQFVILDKR